jgi:hypothetical protein
MATRKESEDVHIEKKGVTMIEDVDGTIGMDTIEDTKPGAFVWLCASAAAIGGMLFGCKCDSLSLNISSSAYTSSRRYRCHLRCSGRSRRRPRRQRSYGFRERGHHSTLRCRSTRRSNPGGHHIRQVWPQACNLVCKCSFRKCDHVQGRLHTIQ